MCWVRNASFDNGYSAASICLGSYGPSPWPASCVRATHLLVPCTLNRQLFQAPRLQPACSVAAARAQPSHQPSRQPCSAPACMPRLIHSSWSAAMRPSSAGIACSWFWYSESRAHSASPPRAGGSAASRLLCRLSASRCTCVGCSRRRGCATTCAAAVRQPRTPPRGGSRHRVQHTCAECRIPLRWRQQELKQSVGSAPGLLALGAPRPGG